MLGCRDQVAEVPNTDPDLPHHSKLYALAKSLGCLLESLECSRTPLRFRDEAGRVVRRRSRPHAIFVVNSSDFAFCVAFRTFT